MTEVELPKPFTDYFTVTNPPTVQKFLTPNTPTGYSSSVITGPLTATTLTDPLSLPHAKELAINITVQSISGTTPTLDVYLDVLDPLEPQNKNLVSTQNAPVVSVKLDPTQITTTPVNLRAIISNGQLVVWEGNTATNLGAFNVPAKFMLRFVIGGTSPSYGIIATWEAKY